jgi:hypothetical protein
MERFDFGGEICLAANARICGAKPLEAFHGPARHRSTEELECAATPS